MSYFVFNTSGTTVTIRLYPITSGMPLTNLSSHHRRRLTKGTAFNLTIPNNQGMDLLKVTDLTEDDLNYNSDLQMAFMRNKLKRTYEEAVVVPVEVPVEIFKMDAEMVPPVNELAMVFPVIEAPVEEIFPVLVEEVVGEAEEASAMVAPVEETEEEPAEIPSEEPVEVVDFIVKEEPKKTSFSSKKKKKGSSK
jgi:hypothetical protein